MLKTALLTLASGAARVLPDGLKRTIYRLGPLTRSLRAALNRAAPAGLSEVVVAGGVLQGWRFLTDLQTEKDYWLGTYELDLQQALRTHVRTGWVVYDVGANAGYISLMLAHLVGESGRVYAFEPLAENVARLRENIKINGRTEQIIVNECAVGDCCAKVSFYPGSSDDTGSLAGSAGKRQTQGEAVLVDGLSLDAFVYERGNPAPAAVKMDIEGGEVLALPGMRRVLNEAAPLLFLEIHSRRAAEETWRVLTECRYAIYPMAKDAEPVSDPRVLGRRAYVFARRRT